MFKKYIFFDRKTVGSARKLVFRYGVKYKSYAGEVLQRIYHFYFGDAMDIMKEYRRYYKKEYNDFDKYLECHFGIPKDMRDKFVCNKVVYVNLDYKGDHIGDSFYYDDELKNQFWSLVGGLENEDTNGICYEQFFD